MPKRPGRGDVSERIPKRHQGHQSNEPTGNENCETRRRGGNIQDVLGRYHSHPNQIKETTVAIEEQTDAFQICRDVVTMHPEESNTARKFNNGIRGAPNSPICSEFSGDNTMNPRNHSGSPTFDSGTGSFVSTEHDSSCHDTILVVLSEMTDTAASQLKLLCDNKAFPGKRLTITYTFTDSFESLHDAALKIASGSAQLIKDCTKEAKNVFLCGLGLGSLVVAELLKNNFIAYTEVHGVISFIGNHKIPAVYDEEHLKKWYYTNSRVFVTASHGVWSRPLRHFRQHGTLIKSSSIQEALVEASGFIRARITR